MGTKADPGTACLGETYNLTTVQPFHPGLQRRSPAAQPLTQRPQHPMKFQPDKSSAQTIHGYGPGWIGVDGTKHTQSLIVGSSGLLQVWDCAHFAALTPEHFEYLATLETELIIFGSGLRNRFPNPAWLRPLMARRLGLETMDTAAACRTYNILAGEGRNVVAALILETGEPPAA